MDLSRSIDMSAAVIATALWVFWSLKRQPSFQPTPVSEQWLARHRRTTRQPDR
jgi:hypothetical protein